MARPRMRSEIAGYGLAADEIRNRGSWLSIGCIVREAPSTSRALQRARRAIVGAVCCRPMRRGACDAVSACAPRRQKGGSRSVSGSPLCMFWLGQQDSKLHNWYQKPGSCHWTMAHRRTMRTRNASVSAARAFVNRQRGPNPLRNSQGTQAEWRLHRRLRVRCDRAR